MQNTETVRFFYNGIKVGTGPLIQGWLHIDDGKRYGSPDLAPHISFSSKGYDRLPAAVVAVFAVRNDTDLNTDYFDHDRFNVSVTHQLFRDAAAALAKNLSRGIARCEKRGAVGADDANRYRRDLAKLNAIVAALATEAA